MSESEAFSEDSIVAKLPRFSPGRDTDQGRVSILSANITAGFRGLGTDNVSTPKSTKAGQHESRGVIKRKPGPQPHRDGKRSRSSTLSVPPGREDEPISLYDMLLGARPFLRQNDVEIHGWVDKWLELFQREKVSALLELDQFFIQCTGSAGVITRQMLETLSVSGIIEKISEADILDESGDYPLMITKTIYRDFSKKLSDFVEIFIGRCEWSLICDRDFMDNILSYLFELKQSTIRAFRHTSTFISLKLTTALVNTLVAIEAKLSAIVVQLHSERRKSPRRRTQAKLESLAAQKQECELMKEELDHRLTLLFDHVFVTRYRDTYSEIRKLCIGEFGVWVDSYPDRFVKDELLKHIGWTLHDIVSDVRLKCVEVLLTVFENYNAQPKLENVLNCLKGQIIRMTADLNNHVSIEAIKLMTTIYKLFFESLSEDDIVNVTRLVYVMHRPVAQASGEFLKLCLDGLADKQGHGGEAKNAVFIKNLACFFTDCCLSGVGGAPPICQSEHAPYLVDCLIESTRSLVNWKYMTDMLLEEGNPLVPELEHSLVLIMCACVEQAATGESPIGRDPKRKLTNKTQGQARSDRVVLTKHFLEVLPRLLLKYGNEKLQRLLSIPLHFDRNVCAKLDQGQFLPGELLVVIDEILSREDNSEVLRLCGKVYSYLYKGKKIFSLDDLNPTPLFTFLQSYKDIDNSNEDDMMNLSATLNKATSLYRCNDVGLDQEGWLVLSNWVQRATVADGEDALLPDILKNSVACCYTYLANDLRRLKQMRDGGNLAEGDIGDLKTKLNQFMEACTVIMDNNKDTSLRQEAYKSVCLCLVMFSKSLTMADDQLKDLVFLCDGEIILQMRKFVESCIFRPLETDGKDEGDVLSELNVRRGYLSSFCQLIKCRLISTGQASHVFKHLIKFNDDYGDIIKLLIKDVRDLKTEYCLQAMRLALKDLFDGSRDRLDQGPEEFGPIKELAKSFAMSFGRLRGNGRFEEMVKFHQAGINYSLKSLEESTSSGRLPTNLKFLEVLAEFTRTLGPLDRKDLKKYLDRKLAGNSLDIVRISMWTSLTIYGNSLDRGTV